MTSVLATKLGFKSSSSASKADVELERVRKENAHLRRKMDELAKRHIRSPDSDKTKLLERILSLETLRERNNQQLLVKEQEMENMRHQLSARGGEVVASLQAQLEQRRKEAEHRDQLYQKLSDETQSLKNKLATMSSRCQSLEALETQSGQVSPGDRAVLQDQLRDALEKNQQWLAYDQQREAYVQSVLARSLDLENQLARANQALQQQKDGSSSDVKPAGSEKLQSHGDQLLLCVQKDLETQREQATRAQQDLQAQREQTSRAHAELQAQKEQVSRLQDELSALQRSYGDRNSELSSSQRRYEEKSKELSEAKEQLRAERHDRRHTATEERKVSSEQSDRMRAELEAVGVRLEEERKRSAELLLQVNVLQKSLLSQNEEQRRIAALEQQIQLSAKDFEDEKVDRQAMQHQLQKVLKELRKARDQIAKLESAKQPSARFSEPSSYGKLEFERLAIGDLPGSSSSPKVTNLLDESFLECPRCHTPYPTSQHRELLAHIDYCFA